MHVYALVHAVFLMRRPNFEVALKNQFPLWLKLEVPKALVVIGWRLWMSTAVAGDDSYSGHWPRTTGNPIRKH